MGPRRKDGSGAPGRPLYIGGGFLSPRRGRPSSNNAIPLSVACGAHCAVDASSELAIDHANLGRSNSCRTEFREQWGARGVSVTPCMLRMLCQGEEGLVKKIMIGMRSIKAPSVFLLFFVIISSHPAQEGGGSLQLDSTRQ